MTYQEEHRDLFYVDASYYLAHCIASDLRMGAGIALPMQSTFNLRQQIRQSGESTNSPTCVLTGHVFNLITKRSSSGKPTYVSLTSALINMKATARNIGVTKIAMPKIGCGLDRLQWGTVRGLIRDVFSKTDIQILVCVWP